MLEDIFGDPMNDTAFSFDDDIMSGSVPQGDVIFDGDPDVTFDTDPDVIF